MTRAPPRSTPFPPTSSSPPGRRHDAVAPTEEAVTIHRQLAATNPAFLNDLASALNNLGIRYSDLDRLRTRLTSTHDAITNAGLFLTTQPALLYNLSRSINNL